MKRIVLIGIGLLVGGQLYAQKAFILNHQSKNGFLNVNGGVSLPTGNFSSKSSQNDLAGMALKGFTSNASAGYRVVGPVGLMVRYERTRNQMDASGMLDLVYKADGTSWSAKAGQWSLSTVMAGPYVSIPVRLFTIDVRALAGQLTATCPATSMEGSFADIPIAVRTNSALSKATAYGTGLTVRYRLGTSFALQVNTDYSHSKVTFSEMTTSSSSGFDREQTATYSSMKPISFVSISAGLTFLFGNRNRVF
ncbi:hypothetical protein [Arsenicibacter rosenii]|uniref:Outer membrane protein beta-barrel domain-containing protein n=1 Tax=Arsenicibacter rosenii TaxID=1750698 RepID=A0A1S2VKQ1_9BACT|nr:hypothetical protein [Arsenicibacter rosenii]OIN58980.1 hypothetical protein BLX24_12240 [Arsenicibacter rosenii]